MTVELNVVDKNVPPIATHHESLIASVNPLTLKIGTGVTTVVKKVKLKVTNADIIPTPEQTSDAIVTVKMQLPGHYGGDVGY